MAEKAQLMMHRTNLTRAQKFGMENSQKKRQLTTAIERAVETLLDRLKVARDTDLKSILVNVPLEQCDRIADAMMIEADANAKNPATLQFYYAFDLLCGLFRTRVMAFKQPRMSSEVGEYQNSALALIRFHLSESDQTSSQDKRKTSAGKSDGERFAEVMAYADHLALDLTQYGKLVAIQSLESGKSAAEVATELGVLTLARDARELSEDMEKLLRLSIRGAAIQKSLKEFWQSGLIREEVWRKATSAIAKIATPGPETLGWIERSLSDPSSNKDRVAISRV